MPEVIGLAGFIASPSISAGRCRDDELDGVAAAVGEELRGAALGVVEAGHTGTQPGSLTTGHCFIIDGVKE